MTELLGHDRGKARQCGEDGLGEGRRFVADGRNHFHGSDSEGIQLVLGMGNEISPARQHFPDGADRQGHMLDAVQDHAVLPAENQVAVLAHQLHDQGFPAEIPHLVQMFDMEMKNALQRGLGHSHDASAPQMLAEQHTETRRGHGRGFIFICQVGQRQTRRSRKQKSVLVCVVFYGKQEFIGLGLDDFCDASSGQLIG